MSFKFCNKCKKEKCIRKFLSYDRKNEYKMCNKCRKSANKGHKKNLCKHGKRKTYCVLCGGNSLCIPHKKIISNCNVCSKIHFVFI